MFTTVWMLSMLVFANMLTYILRLYYRKELLLLSRASI
jgi:hypothetical protein